MTVLALNPFHESELTSDTAWSIRAQTLQDPATWDRIKKTNITGEKMSMK